MRRISPAFTLIEILVSVIIILTITGFGLVGYRKFNEDQLLKQAAKQVETHLRDAQNRALAGEKDLTICDDKVLDRWFFNVPSGDLTQYQIFGRCETLDFPQPIPVYYLPTNVYFQQAYLYFFKPLSGGAQEGTITLNYGNPPTKSITITITFSGEITVGEIQSY